MRLKPKLYDDRIVVTINVSVYSVKALEDLANEGGKCLRKRNPLNLVS